jgi:cyclophilin family peptidyl-prolyl cis-trans isomerase
MSRPTLAILAVLMLVLAAGCGKSDKPAASKTNSTAAQANSTTGTQAAAPGASGCKAATPKNKGEQHLAKPTATLPQGKKVTLQLITSCGEIDIALDVKRAPRTAASVAYLARKGFYDGLSFHRIAKLPTGGDFVIQGGDPTGTGNSGPGYSIKEKPPAGVQYTRGVVAMAKTEIEPAGTSGSQFFIVTAEDSGLPADYALLGNVIKGDNVVSRIAAVPTDSSERPTAPVVIEQAKVVAG